MTNFEQYLENLTEDKFIDSMILNCDGCPAFPCDEENETSDNGYDCEVNLREWCSASKS